MRLNILTAHKLKKKLQHLGPAHPIISLAAASFRLLPLRWTTPKQDNLALLTCAFVLVMGSTIKITTRTQMYGDNNDMLDVLAESSTDLLLLSVSSLSVCDSVCCCSLCWQRRDVFSDVFPSAITSIFFRILYFSHAGVCPMTELLIVKTY